MTAAPAVAAAAVVRIHVSLVTPLLASMGITRTEVSTGWFGRFWDNCWRRRATRRRAGEAPIWRFLEFGHSRAFLLMIGAYVDNGDSVLMFRGAPPVDQEELTELAASIRARIMKLVKRRGLLVHDGANNEAPQPDALGACANVSLSKGRRERSGPALGLVDEDEVEHPRGGVVAYMDGLNLYASNVVDGKNRERMEVL